MKYYRWTLPNPAVTDGFIAARGIKVDTVDVNLFRGENRQPPYVDLYPEAKLPLLVLDDGTVIAESIAICEYLDEITPGPSLIGATPQERAVTRMWVRRLDFNVTQPLSQAWRYGDGVDLCRRIMHVIPQAAADLKLIAQEGLRRFNAQMADNEYICGDQLRVADILLYVFLMFGDNNGQPTDPDLHWVAAWRKRLSAQPFASAIVLRSAPKP